MNEVTSELEGELVQCKKYSLKYGMRKLFSWLHGSLWRNDKRQQVDELSRNDVSDLIEFRESLSQQLRELTRLSDRRHDADGRELEKVGKKILKQSASEAADLKIAAHECRKTVQGVRQELDAIGTQLQGVREYAMSQQDMLRNYEEGFSWSVIKALGNRLIRCIDSLDMQITLEEDGSDVVKKLAPVKDELLFALEAHGVEQLVYEHGTSFDGNENLMKIVGVVDTNDVNQNKKVAETKRPGYVVIVGNAQKKLIRPAEVVVYKSIGE